MKIAVVVFLFGGASGGIKAANSIATQLSQIGHKVSILTCEEVKGTFFDVDPNVDLRTIGKAFANQGNNDDDAQKEDREYLFGNLEDRFIPLRHKQKYTEDLLYRDLTILQPDCIVSVLFQTHFFAIPAATRAGIPVIASEHNSPKSYRELWWMSQDELDYLYHLLSFADKIHLLSPLYKDGYPDRLHSKMVVIGNSVDSVAPDVLLEDRERENCIIAVGELSQWKNFGTLIAAFSLVTEEFPDWLLKIYGEGPEKGDLLKKINQDPKLSDKVYLMGIAPHKQILKELNRAKIFCHPSLAESFGLAVAEGMAAGLPAIGLKETDGVNTLIRNGYNGYLVSSDYAVGEMAAALNTLMADPALLLNLSKNAVESTEGFSNDAMAHKWNELVKWVFKPSTLRKKNMTQAGAANPLPLVSFLTVCRSGQEQTALRCMESIWEQNYDYVEHLVIGAGEIENQLKPILRDHLPKIDHFFFDHENYLNGAINKGINSASGDIICILDCSDWLDRFACERAIYQIHQHQQDIVVGSVAIHTDHVSHFSPSHSLDISAIWTGSFIHRHVLFARKSTYDRIRLYDSGNTDDLVRLKGLFEAQFSSMCVHFDNSVFLHSSSQTSFELDEFNRGSLKSLAKDYFEKLTDEHIDVLIEIFYGSQTNSIAEDHRERVFHILKNHVNNKEFVYSVVKSILVKESVQGLQAAIPTIYDGKESKNFAGSRFYVYSFKDIIRHKLRGTIFFKPAKRVYQLMKKVVKKI